MLSLSCLLAVGSSLSARRAWIEIVVGSALQCRDRVALRKESVDRNLSRDVDGAYLVKSLSARRAWIEIRKLTHHQSTYRRRSPQGERG